MLVVLYIFIEGFIYILFVQFLTISTCNYVYLTFRRFTTIAIGSNLNIYTEDTADETWTCEDREHLDIATSTGARLHSDGDYRCVMTSVSLRRR